LQLKDHLSRKMSCCFISWFCSRYVGKMFNDDLMRERGFLEEEV
jgi:hypothetical protein